MTWSSFTWKRQGAKSLGRSDLRERPGHELIANTGNWADYCGADLYSSWPSPCSGLSILGMSLSILNVLGFAPPTWIARRRIAGLFALLLLVAPGTADAQPTAGIISPPRATAWSGAGVAGGIPDRTTICATLNPGASAVEINLAIAACPSGQVVFLTAGTYDLSTGISFGITSNVTLRGAGAHQTFLKFSGGTFDCAGVHSPICIGSNYANNQFPENSTLWTAGYEVGTTVITVGARRACRSATSSCSTSSTTLRTVGRSSSART